jgi:integrase
MLIHAVDAYLSLRRAVGFKLESDEYLLRDFARWAAERGQAHVRADTAIQWAAVGPSPWQRERRLRTVVRFARHARAEDRSHEVPPKGVFAQRPIRRLPHIYTTDEIRRLLEAVARPSENWLQRPRIYAALFGLLVSTGLRVSEALALRFDDVTHDGLVVRKTKFNKTRLVPLHPTAAAALDRYLDLRRRESVVSDYVFISPKGGRLSCGTVRMGFLKLARKAGLRGTPGSRGPRVHDLRHTFAVHALESSPGGGSPVGQQVRALSTYLGHANLADTYWYLQWTPQLMRSMANACESFLEGGVR